MKNIGKILLASGVCLASVAFVTKIIEINQRLPIALIGVTNRWILIQTVWFNSGHFYFVAAGIILAIVGSVLTYIQKKKG